MIDEGYYNKVIIKYTKFHVYYLYIYYSNKINIYYIINKKFLTHLFHILNAQLYTLKSIADLKPKIF